MTTTSPKFHFPSVAGLLFIAIGSAQAQAASEGMPSMPKIAPKKTYLVPSREAGEALQEQWGFGDEEPTVRMMNLMMVGGSGYEGMDMSQMQMAENTPAAGAHQGHGMNPGSQAPESPPSSYQIELKPTKTPVQVGANPLEIEIRAAKGQVSPKGLVLSVEVYMTNMDMGTERPKAREVSPGRFQTKAIFSMQGPWAVKVSLPDGTQKIFPFQVVKK